MERTSRLLIGLEALPASLLICFRAIITVNKDFLNTNTATNANCKNARSRMEASSAGKHGYRDKGR
jgi:hypothetical protein